jgi:hypothetical protein
MAAISFKSSSIATQVPPLCSEAFYSYQEVISTGDRLKKLVLSIFKLFICLNFKASRVLFNEFYSGKKTIHVSISEIGQEAVDWIKKVSADCPEAESGFTPRHAIEFIKRGGKLQLASKDAKVICRRDENIITGCAAGYNRSQTMYAWLSIVGCTVSEVLAGGISAVNPARKKTFEETSEQKANFAQVFRRERKPVLGSHLGHDSSTLASRRGFFRNFFKELTPTHFAVFHYSASSSIQRLLERKGSLEGFKISYIPMHDTIRETRSADIKPESAEAFTRFLQELSEYVTVE